MKYNEMWNEFICKNDIGDDVDYGVFEYEKEDIDNVLNGSLCAEISPYDVIRYNDYAIPFVGDYNIIIDDKENAICVIKTNRVDMIPFIDIKEQMAKKLGFDSIENFRERYKKILASELKEIKENYKDEAVCVIEEFEVVYK